MQSVTRQSEGGETFQPYDRETLLEAVVLWIQNEAEAFLRFGDIGAWDVSQITNMAGLFRCAASFNADISRWDVSNVTDMSQMFIDTPNFNCAIGEWNVSNVVNMWQMFQNASSFNQDISGWDVSNVTTMTEMFRGALTFNQPIGKWNVSNVIEMGEMFSYAPSFNQDISGWDVSNVTLMTKMFLNAASFQQDLGSWDIQSLTDMRNMFLHSGCTYETSNLAQAKINTDRKKRKTIKFNTFESGHILRPLERISLHFLVFFVFHWVFIITLPIILGLNSKCTGGSHDFSSMWIVFGCYSLITQAFEFYIVWENPMSRRWLNSRSKIGFSFCRIFWFFPVLLDLSTTTLSRADLLTDVGFISLISNCGDRDLFISALVLFVIGVIGLQFLLPLLIAFQATLSKDETKKKTVVNICSRGCSMMLVSKLLRSMIELEYDGNSWSRETDITASAATANIAGSVIRLIFEDVVQATIQVIYVLRQDGDLTTSENTFVIISISLAIFLSISRTITSCYQRKYRDRCLDKLMRLIKWEPIRINPSATPPTMLEREFESEINIEVTSQFNRTRIPLN